MTRLLKFAATALILCLITACSGGGGGNSSSTTAPSSSTNSGSTTPVTPDTSGGTTTPATPTTPATTIAHTLQLSWAVPATRENGDVLTTAELAGYQIYYYQDGSSADAGDVVSVAGGGTTSAQISINGSGTYYFAIAARDQTGLLSALSNYAAVTLN